LPVPRLLESDVAVDRDADQPPASAIRRVNLTAMARRNLAHDDALLNLEMDGALAPFRQ